MIGFPCSSARRAHLSLPLSLSLSLSFSLSVTASAFDLSDLTVTFVGRTRFYLLKYTKFLSRVSVCERERRKGVRQTSLLSPSSLHTPDCTALDA